MLVLSYCNDNVHKCTNVQSYAGAVSELKRVIPAVVAMAMWATNFVFSQSVIADIGAIQLTGARWMISLVALVPLALWLEKQDWAIIRRELPIHLVQSILGYVGYTLLLYSALQSTSPVTAAVLVALNHHLAALYVGKVTQFQKIGRAHV